MITYGSYALTYVPASESARRETVCVHVDLCVFLSAVVCAVGCMSMHMYVCQFCSRLLFLAERSQMREADKFKEVKKIS